MDDRILSLKLEGALSKWVDAGRCWQSRWCVLDTDSGIFTYYESKAKMQLGERRGFVNLKGAIIGIDDQDDCAFTLTKCEKTLLFQSQTSEERTQWIFTLSDTISRLNAISRLAEVEETNNSLSKIDKTMRETDLYLQTLLQLLETADKRVEKFAPLDETRVRYSYIHDSTVRVVRYLRQAMRCLQAYKVRILSDSDMATYIDLRIQTHSCDSSPTRDRAMHLRGNFSTAMLPQTKLSRNVGQVVSSSNRQCKKYLSIQDDAAVADAWRNLQAIASCDNLVLYTDADRGKVSNQTRLGVLSVARSSTCCNDDFFDADETDYSAASSDNASIKPKRSSAKLAVDTSATSDLLATSTSASNESISESTAVTVAVPAVAIQEPLISNVIAADDDEFDELYDDMSNSDVKTSSQQGSVIMHLVKQVRIGMDLTKVTLPTFILETRSTLEMYADFFAHPDIWSAIADQPTPRDRLLQTLRWYLSAFHAGRRSNAAKKPYNPILGEVFLCFWDVPKAAQVKQPQTVGNCVNKADSTGKTCAAADLSAMQKLLSTGPVREAHTDSVTFVSEQVSHHPPVSAFYAENIDKWMMLTGSIWTKSKFLGLSVAVEMVGQATINLIHLDENYTITFPTGYGRNILGQPWIELGGSCEIRCAKTGYYATVEFKTAPVCGGSRNQVRARAYQPDQKKPFATIEGEWNSKMMVKYGNSSPELFIDTRSIAIVKKRVQPRTAQAPNESRRLWENVTRALKQRKIEEATRFKQALESKQRSEAKQRDLIKSVWHPEHFIKTESNSWRYKHPLGQRLQTLEQAFSSGSNANASDSSVQPAATMLSAR